MKTNVDCVSGLKILLLILALINIFSIVDTDKDSSINFIRTSSEVILPSVPKIVKVDDTTNINNDKLVINNDNKEVLNVYYGNISHYGPDCAGCSGKTANGYNVKGGNIYYNDNTYGIIRIVAADKSIPFGTIVKLNLNSGPVNAIVLDRGGGIGFNKRFLFDLLCESEEESYSLGINKNTKVEILRYGF